MTPRTSREVLTALLLFLAAGLATARGASPTARIDGSEPGWHALDGDDFVAVNCAPDTWVWKGGGVKCSGKPTGVIRSSQSYQNFEFMAEWKHLQPGGTSGIFVWTPSDALEGLEPDVLPASGIEVQVLDHGYTQQYEASSGNKADWFTTHGDVFPVGSATMQPFAPVSPDGKRSFPRKQLSKGVGEWNSYYIRCINGEIRLWVNGEEVSGGTNCNPREGYLCLESEGAPVEFQGLRIRELP